MVVIRREQVTTDADGGTTRLVQGETRLRYRTPLLPLLSIGMTLMHGLSWDGFRVDAIRADAATGLVVGSMVIAAQNELAYAGLIREWSAKGWR